MKQNASKTQEIATPVQLVLEILKQSIDYVYGNLSSVLSNLFNLNYEDDKLQ